MNQNDYVQVPNRADNHSRTVLATNVESSIRTTLVALVAVIGITVIVFWLVQDTLAGPANMSRDIAQTIGVVAGLVAFVLVGRYALLIVNGEYSAVREIDQHEKTERTRVHEQADVARGMIGLETLREENRHTEAVMVDETERLRISTAQDFERVHHRIAMLEEISLRGGQPIQPTAAPSFVTARERPAVAAARRWSENLYGVDGAPNPDRVHGRGALKRGVPWAKKGGDWNGQTWSATAEHILTTEQAGLPPLIIPIMADGSVRGYALNIADYPTSADLLRLMDYIINTP